MTSFRRKVIKEREVAVTTRVTELNRRLKLLSRYTVTYVPRGPESWCILPTDKMFQNDGLPIFGNKYRHPYNRTDLKSVSKLLEEYFRLYPSPKYYDDYYKSKDLACQVYGLRRYIGLPKESYATLEPWQVPGYKGTSRFSHILRL